MEYRYVGQDIAESIKVLRNISRLFQNNTLRYRNCTCLPYLIHSVLVILLFAVFEKPRRQMLVVSPSNLSKCPLSNMSAQAVFLDLLYHYGPPTHHGST